MIEPEIADATREALQPLIRRPKLSDKLLSKPPFRFLHDIVSNVTKATGFAEGLFEGDELVGTAIKGKGPKCSYLEKIINCVGICLGEEIDVRVGKIVAGLEPENTNIFLQALGRVASDDAKSVSVYWKCLHAIQLRGRLDRIYIIDLVEALGAFACCLT